MDYLLDIQCRMRWEINGLTVTKGMRKGIREDQGDSIRTHFSKSAGKHFGILKNPNVSLLIVVYFPFSMVDLFEKCYLIALINSLFRSYLIYSSYIFVVKLGF